jgi:hypothetical protein
MIAHSRDVKLFQDWGFDYLKLVHLFLFVFPLCSDLNGPDTTIVQVNIVLSFFFYYMHLCLGHQFPSTISPAKGY